jgi:multicomponent K+:H+ antiporter subunit E
MTRLLPYPGLSLALALFWLLLQNSMSALSLLGAVLIGLVAPWSLVLLEVPRPRVRSYRALFRLAGVVAHDIVGSNLAVARIILSGARRDRRAGFVVIPLELTNHYGLAVLAIIITSTPGTLWVQHDAATNRLLLHVFDLVNEPELIALIKQRYESRLREIFG